jgi:ABC-type lipoprotein release transport system permease subunit
VRVAIVSESAVRTLFGGHSPLGRSFEVEGAPGRPPLSLQVVGVVADTKYSALREPFEPLVYLAATQEPPPPAYLRIVLRTDTAMSATTAGATRAVVGVHPAIAIRYQEVRTQLARSLTRERLMATLSGFFGGLAVLIATIGLYGVMSYMVTRRRVEIGVRMALGADAGSVVRMLVREAGVLLLAGLVIGGVLSVYAARIGNTLLYGLQPGDPATLALAMTALASVTLLAGWIPAIRASRVDPTTALRAE